LSRNITPKTKEIILIENDEQIFHEIFLYDFLNLMEFFSNSDNGTNSVDFPQCNIVSNEVCYYIKLIFTFEKQPNTNVCFYVFPCFNRFLFWKMNTSLQKGKLIVCFQ